MAHGGPARIQQASPGRKPDMTDSPDTPTPVFEPPRVNAVGLVVHATDEGGTPRQFSAVQRWVAWLFLAFFFAVTVVTTVVSLGTYCLTSDGADTRQLHASPWMERDVETSPDEKGPEPPVERP